MGYFTTSWNTGCLNELLSNMECFSQRKLLHNSSMCTHVCVREVDSSCLPQLLFPLIFEKVSFPEVEAH